MTREEALRIVDAKGGDDRKRVALMSRMSTEERAELVVTIALALSESRTRELAA